MKVISALLLMLFASTSFASQCFELSKDGKIWDSKPFTLCFEANNDGMSEFKLTLSKDNKNIAIYYLNALPGAADARVFGVNAMNGSIMDDSVTISIGYGEVMIGSGKYFYKE